MTAEPMNFAFFEAGRELGRRVIDAAPLVQAWDHLFPRAEAHSSQYLTAPLLVAILMRGYTMILDRRLPGNVHAGQNMIWGSPAVRGVPLMVGLACLEKELRKDRPWLTFSAFVESMDGARHLDARMRFLWAG